MHAARLAYRLPMLHAALIPIACTCSLPQCEWGSDRPILTRPHVLSYLVLLCCLIFMVSIALVDARKTSLTGVQNSQKNRLAATRLVDDAPHRRWVKPPPPPLGKKLDPPLLPIRKRIQFKSLTLTYKCLNNQAPTYLSDLLVPRQSSYNTRSSQHLLLHVPRTYKSVGDRAFSLCAPKLWNNLPHYLQQFQSLNTFKKSLKFHLF